MPQVHSAFRILRSGFPRYVILWWTVSLLGVFNDGWYSSLGSILRQVYYTLHHFTSGLFSTAQAVLLFGLIYHTINFYVPKAYKSKVYCINIILLCAQYFSTLWVPVRFFLKIKNSFILQKSTCIRRGQQANQPFVAKLIQIILKAWAKTC
jgi:hypothetical protein